MKRSLHASLVILTLAAPAWGADIFTIQDRQSDLATTGAEGAMLDSFNDAADAVEAEVNGGVLAEASRNAFSKRMADAAAVSLQGLGADYGSSPEKFSIGAAVSGGLNFGGAGVGSADQAFTTVTDSLPNAGAGAQASLIVGFNAGNIGIKRLGPLDGSRLNLYANFFTLSISDIAGEGVSVDFLNAGLHAQYRLVPGGKEKGGFGGPFKWGGLQLTTGLEYARMRLSYESDLDVSQSSDTGTGDTNTVNWSTNDAFGVASNVFRVPLEVSTNIRLLYALGFFFGTGVDFNFGSAGFEGVVSGPITTSTTSAISKPNLFSATGEIDFEASEDFSPDLVTPKVFAGVQLHIYLLKVFVQATYLTNDGWGATAGIRVAL